MILGVEACVFEFAMVHVGMIRTWLEHASGMLLACFGRVLAIIFYVDFENNVLAMFLQCFCISSISLRRSCEGVANIVVQELRE